MKAFSDDKIRQSGSRLANQSAVSTANSASSRVQLRRLLASAEESQQTSIQANQPQSDIAAAKQPEKLEDQGFCIAPLGMDIVTSGPFYGNKSVSVYRPELAGQGYWPQDRDSTAGTFDTGASVKNKTASYKAGATVQLIGQIDKRCKSISDQFVIGQLVEKFPDPMAGRKPSGEHIYHDDIKENIGFETAQRAPFRQEFELGKSYCITFCDTPYVDYGPRETRELVREFESFITGPQHSKASVVWKLSTKVVAGTVTQNELKVVKHLPK